MFVITRAILYFVHILFLKLLIDKDIITKTGQNEMHPANFSTHYKHKL
jgi:hypothetical protein